MNPNMQACITETSHERGNNHDRLAPKSAAVRVWVQLMTVVFVVLLLIQSGQAQRPISNAQQAPVSWLSGRQLDDTLRLPVSANWENAPLRDLMQLSRQQRIAVVIDRRIDPTQNMNFSASGITMEQLLWKLGDKHGFSVCRIEDAFYVGPEEATARLPALLELTKSLRKKAKEAGKPFPSRWKSRSPLSWPVLSTPNSVLTSIAQKNKFTIQNPEAIPHDLWPAADLPVLSLEARIGLTLAGFDLWYQPVDNGRGIKIRPIPNLKSGTEILPNVSDAKKWAKQLKELFPNCQFQSTGKSIRMTGDLNTLQEMRREVCFSQKPEIVAGAKTVFSFSSDSRRIDLLKQLSQQLGKELEIPESASAALNQEISIRVKEKSIEEILATILQGTGLKFSIAGNVWKIE